MQIEWKVLVNWKLGTERLLSIADFQKKIAFADPNFASRWQMGFMSWFWPGLVWKLSLCQYEWLGKDNLPFHHVKPLLSFLLL